MEQLTIFNCFPQALPEPQVGEYVTEFGANICHIMRPAYIGKKVIYDCSTANHAWYRCGILEKYFMRENGVMRSVIYTGERQRILYDHYPGREIWECLPWDAYPKRMEAIYGHHKEH